MVENGYCFQWSTPITRGSGALAAAGRTRALIAERIKRKAIKE